jgi:hypothetical protein
MDNSRLIRWYELQKMKDEVELNSIKINLIEEIKTLKKEDIIKKEKPLTLWNRLKKVMGF